MGMDVVAFIFIRREILPLTGAGAAGKGKLHISTMRMKFSEVSKEDCLRNMQIIGNMNYN